MAARKLQQEVDKCFKKVAEGVAEFEAIYEKIEQSNNPAQKEKQEDNLKREIKKLQRLRDQIKTWAASNDIKDKAPLLEHRKLIETQMEKFKAVEKAMKTKAYSQAGLSAAAKLDPKEQAKVEACDFLNSMVDELELQIETLEAENESIQATMKKGKNKIVQENRMAEIDRIIEKHKWHQGKLELIRRTLENGGIDTDDVTGLEEQIRYYVSDGMNEDYMDDDEIYDDLDLEEEEGVFGMNQDNEKNSSQDTQSIQDDTHDFELPAKPRKPAKDSDSTTSTRTKSVQSKSPLPALATLHTPLSAIGSGGSGSPAMKPASIPSRPAGEGLKYASAAAAAAAADKNNVGIAPLPPPPGVAAGISPLPPAQLKTSATNSPAVSFVQPAQAPEPKQATPVVAPASTSTPAPASTPAPVENAEAPSSTKATKKSKASGKQPATSEAPPSEASSATQANGSANGVKSTTEETEEESIYHLPASLQDLVESYETSRKRPYQPLSPSTLSLMKASQLSYPSAFEADVPRTYRPDMPVPQTGSGFPTQPLPIFDDPRLYSRIDPDTLFYVFYYKQGTAQQYLAAKALKDQSWRFHKQYQTWFQRHEEPKNITEEFEQGTYRFFDYESTWMNRRKADFKFAYKFLEDDI
ncbi:uncharacterized protein TrAFT101_006200 [Trichoderma asperellum]|uniref:uncharacterized protein n=1 Tax=Trichoderma asperellum TaxID=101201 RepID=UPI003320D39F|nr:hypothetical protein TrAFT101_006200 [Trichoderma asperellum]